jgi:hypothetical protein
LPDVEVTALIPPYVEVDGRLPTKKCKYKVNTLCCLIRQDIFHYV